MLELEAPEPSMVVCEYCSVQVDKRDLKHHQSFECLNSETRIMQEHNNENIAFHLGLINKSSVARDQRMAVLEKTLRSREMELAQLHKTIEKEREDRLEMMQQYDDRIQSLLELFEKKMESNSADCKRALTGAMLTATNVDKMRRTVDGLSYTMQVHKIATAAASPSCLPRKACACGRSG